MTRCLESCLRRSQRFLSMRNSLLKLTRRIAEVLKSTGHFLKIIDGSILGNLIDDDLFVLIMLQHFAYSGAALPPDSCELNFRTENPNRS